MPRFEDIKRISRATYTVDIEWGYLKSWLESNLEEVGLNMDPPYQRGYVWTDTQKTAYIE